MDWRKSSRSIGGGECVEVAALDDLAVAVRDSADPGGPVLVLSAEAWQALVRHVKVVS
jgi:hypothetical protein